MGCARVCCAVCVLQPGDVIHILHVIAPPKRPAMTPDFAMDGVIEEGESRCEVVSAGTACLSDCTGVALPAIVPVDC